MCDVAGSAVEARIVDGPWSESLSDLAGCPVRIARPERPGRCQIKPVTLLSRASVDRLAHAAGHDVDGRRFRMLFTLAGCAPHEEDGWSDRRLRIGGAVIRVGGPVDRCAVTTRDPDTGERDLDTLALIRTYRGLSPEGTISFGVFGDVEAPGTVSRGDVVEHLDNPSAPRAPG